MKTTINVTDENVLKAFKEVLENGVFKTMNSQEQNFEIGNRVWYRWDGEEPELFTVTDINENCVELDGMAFVPKALCKIQVREFPVLVSYLPTKRCRKLRKFTVHVEATTVRNAIVKAIKVFPFKVQGNPRVVWS